MSKPSAAQIDANRRNAKLCHGPNTAGGKQRSSHNALRHGLTGHIVVLPTEDVEVYNAFSKELVDSLNPASPMERQFAQTIADTQWRLNRARTVDDGMFALGHYEDTGNFNAESPELHSALTSARVFRDRSRDFVNLTLYEQRLLRTQREAIRQLREFKAERESLEMRLSAASVPVSPVTQARTMTAGQTITPTPAVPCEEIGFVYSNAVFDPPSIADQGGFPGPNLPTQGNQTTFTAKKAA
jgi:hypothetical protein